MRSFSSLLPIVPTISACSADAAAPTAADGSVADDREQDIGAIEAVAVPDAGECAIIVRQASGSACVAEWSCRDAGVLVLACGQAEEDGDGGTAGSRQVCVCGPENQPGMTVDAVPPSCLDADLIPFARGYCGWSFL